MGPSTQLGPYRILRLINRGGQGTVYLGYDDRLHRRVAIKIFRLPDHRATRERCLQMNAWVHEICAGDGQPGDFA